MNDRTVSAPTIGAGAGEESVLTSRRSLFAMGAAGAAALLTQSASAQEAVSFDPPITGEGLEETPAILSSTWRDPAVKLARRISFGVTLDSAREARTLGFTGLLEQQMNPARLDDTEVETFVRGECPRAFMNWAQLDRMGDSWRSYLALADASIIRALYSKRQLYWRMVEFWSDHFNIYMWKVDPNQVVQMQREAIQRHAMSNFLTILRAVVHSPAMLDYLDNTRSVGENPNVNFARELMELYTIGVNGGQKQADIRNVAAAFTGWQVGERGSVQGLFYFNPEDHLPGDKTVLGTRIPSGNKAEGDQIIALLAAHPNTARFMSRKLIRWFLNHEPTTAMVNAVAQVWTTSRGDIRTVLRAILTQANVVAAPPKFKRPFHLMTSALRSAGAWGIEDFWHIRSWHLGNMGHEPFHWIPPDGYPDKIDYWAPGILPRLKFTMTLANNRVWGVRTDLERMIGLTRDPARVLNILNAACFGSEMPTTDWNSIRTYLTSQPLTPHRIRGAIALALSSPGFQWY